MKTASRLTCFLVFASALAFAQTGHGNIQGTVKDSSGAVVPGVNVTATHTATSRVYETVANSVGFYLIPSVQFGEYKLAVSAPGFERWEASILLQSGQTANVEPVLKVGGASTQVTVAGDVSAVVDTNSATLSTVLERQRIEQIPQDLRWVTRLMMRTIPGLEGGTWAPRVFGLRENAMELVLDGAELANRTEGDGGLPPTMDSLQEFRVETSNSSAKLSRPATAIFVTKSGSNTVHGSAFWQNQNSALGVARKREDMWRKAPHVVYNQFGASLGGPVYLPKVYNGKNKTFFFFGYEAARFVTGGTMSTTVPTAAMRQGDFSNLVMGNGQRITVYDPWTTDTTTWARQPFPDNRIPASQMSPLAKYLYSLTPLPTNNVNPLVGNNWFGPGPVVRPEHSETFRIDHRISDRDQIFGRFTNQRRLIGEPSNGNYAPAPGYITNYKYNIYNDDNAAISWTHTFSPTFFSETVVSGYQQDYAFQVGDFGTNFATPQNLPNPFNKTGFMQITETGLKHAFGASNPRGSVSRIFNFEENMTKVHGRHTFEFGGKLRYERVKDMQAQAWVAGAHSFGQNGTVMATALYDPGSGGQYSPMPRTGFAGANEFLGLMEYYSVQFVRGPFFLRDQQWHTYFNDNFKVTSRLTLNLGLRWEVSPAMKEANNFLSGFDLANHAIVTGMPLDQMYSAGYTLPSIVNNFTGIGAKFTTPQQAGLPSRFINANWRDIYPRASFAWRASDGSRPLVLRGGFSSFGYLLPTGTYNSQMRNNAPTNAKFENSLNSSAQSPDGLPNYWLRSTPALLAGVNSANALDPNRPNGVTRGSFTTAFFDSDLPTTKANEWNFSIERELMPDTLVRASYVGTHGFNNDQFWNLNPQIPAYVWYSRTGKPIPTGEYAGVATRIYDQTTYGDIFEYRKTGWSNSNAFQFEFNRRYNKGYSLQVFYVLQNAFYSGVNSNDSATGRMMQDPGIYLPGTVPADEGERNRFLNYSRDPSIPKHRVRWNWLVDLPFGRGKLIGGNASGLLNKFIGGWQIAGFGSVQSTYFELSTSDWGPATKPEVYGTKYPVQDCRSGTCYDGYLWYNGYIPANRINSYDANGKPDGVMGVPSGYKPSHMPVNPIPAKPDPADPSARFYDTNTVWVKMADGSSQQVGSPNNNLNPFRQQYLAGPRIWDLSASLYKGVQLKERLTMKFFADFFNVLNMPGLQQPDNYSGIASKQYSQNAARYLQMGLRLNW